MAWGWVAEALIATSLLAQADQDWRVVVLHSSELPQPWRGRLMDLPWNLCPYCAMPVDGTFPSGTAQYELSRECSALVLQLVLSRETKDSRPSASSRPRSPEWK